MVQFSPLRVTAWSYHVNGSRRGREGFPKDDEAPKAYALGAKVEAAGIEPASRGSSMQASTRIVGLLILAPADAGQQAATGASSEKVTLLSRH